jgi:hypothetical protein
MQQFSSLLSLTFIYSSPCFGRSPAYHQELNDCSGSLWFYLRIVVIVVLCSWSGRLAGPTTNTARLSPRYDCKTRAATAVIELLMMGGRKLETCWAVNKRQGNKLENCCTRFVIYLNCNICFLRCAESSIWTIFLDLMDATWIQMK